jgi:hypothetical protein
MRPMTPTDGTEPGQPTPGERRLERPPSDRYRTDEPAARETQVAGGGSFGRGLAFGALTAIGVAAAITVLGGIVLVTAGLIALAALGGWAIAIAIRVGSAGTVARQRRAVMAAVFAALAVAGGQLGLWLFARYEGGVLGPVEYLAETFGLLVPIELAIAIVAGWFASR